MLYCYVRDGLQDWKSIIELIFKMMRINEYQYKVHELNYLIPNQGCMMLGVDVFEGFHNVMRWVADDRDDKEDNAANV